jgi:colanic acid biosynthesis glycosyl transferase WcaI
MRILIVNIYFHPDPTGTGLVLTELARDLVGQGHQVTVITSVPHYGINEGTHRPRPGAGGNEAFSPTAHGPAMTAPKLWQEEPLDGIRVLRTAVYVPRRKTFWSRTLNYLTFSLLAILAGLRSGPQDVILCTSPPLSLGLSAWVLSRLKRTPFLFNVQDIYPDAAVLMGMLRRPRVIQCLRALERFVYQRAALVTVISEGARQNLRAKGVPDEKLAVIPNWVDVDFIRPVRGDVHFRRFLVPSVKETDRLVMFAGNIGLIAGLESVLEAAAELRSRPDLHFALVGEGNAKAALVERAREMELTNVTFLPTQPRDILPELLCAADIHLVTLRRRMSTTSLPSKSYGIMAAGRAMVAAVDPGSEVWRLVETADAGVCVPPEDPAALARAIESLCDDPERRRRMGENARDYVSRYHAKDELTRGYGRTLESVASDAGAKKPGSAVREGSVLTPDP